MPMSTIFIFIFILLLQYLINGRREILNKLIEEAILQAELSKVKVLSLGLLNQASPLLSFYICI